VAFIGVVIEIGEIKRGKIKRGQIERGKGEVRLRQEIFKRQN
jgi:hypothetical protein